MRRRNGRNTRKQFKKRAGKTARLNTMTTRRGGIRL